MENFIGSRRSKTLSLIDQDFLTLKFPIKLWKMIEEDENDAIRWSDSGTSIMLNYSKIKREYLDHARNRFKTMNLSSFIRQLNLYGFKKVNYRRALSNGQHFDEVHEFRHPNFKRGHFKLATYKVNRKKHPSNDEYGKENMPDEAQNSSTKCKNLAQCKSTKLRQISQKKVKSRLIQCRKKLRQVLKKEFQLFMKSKKCWKNNEHQAEMYERGGTHKSSDGASVETLSSEVKYVSSRNEIVKKEQNCCSDVEFVWSVYESEKIRGSDETDEHGDKYEYYQKLDDEYINEGNLLIDVEPISESKMLEGIKLLSNLS
ncbi:Uncharacterised protein r2_g2139 [Pycnogonum litorale]